MHNPHPVPRSRPGWPALALGLLSLTLSSPVAQAQIIPDATLGAESSTLTTTTVSDSPAELIEAGAQRGDSLFHSFTEFNVLEGQRVYFASPGGVDRIFGRVTGVNPSEILGTLGVLGAADLFLLNPNGVVFGPNAALDLGGSLVVSSADSVLFDNNLRFSASAPQAPPLLTIGVPVGLQMGAQPGAIASRSVGGLAVLPQQTLALVGGEVRLEGGNLAAPSGRLELAGLGANAAIALTPDNLGYALGTATDQSLSPVGLANGAIAAVSGAGGGNLRVQGSNLTTTEGSALVANTLGAIDGGRVILLVPGTILLSGTLADGTEGGIFVRSLGAGDAAALTIDTGTLTIEAGAKISAAAFDAGRAGDVTINAADSVNVTGTLGSGRNPSAIFADTEGSGAGGTLTINTGRLRATEGGFISVSSGSGSGPSGNLVINATEAIELDGDQPFPNGSISSGLNAFTLSPSPGGRIVLTTPRLSLTNGGNIVAASFGAGTGGDVVINAPEAVTIAGVTSDGFSSSLSTRSTAANGGAAGSVTITTGQFRLLAGGELVTSTRGQGRGGDIAIAATELIELSQRSPDGSLNSFLSSQTTGQGQAGRISLVTDRLVLADGGQVVATTFGQGDGGLLTVNARDIDISGRLDAPSFASGLFSDVGRNGTGQGAGIQIQAQRLSLSEGGNINVATRGAGNAGNLRVQVQELISISGSFPGAVEPSRISLQSASTAQGNGGSGLIEAGQIAVRDGGQIVATTFGAGNAGSLTLRAGDWIEVQGNDPRAIAGNGPRPSTAIAVDSVGGATGNAGSLDLAAPRVTVRDGAGLFVGSSNSLAGDLRVTADVLALVNGGQLSAEALGTAGGNIALSDLTLLVLRDGSLITARAGNAANGGNIVINAPNGFVVAVAGENSDILASAELGNGGNIAITAQGVFGLVVNPSPDRLAVSEINASSEAGIAGTVAISNPDVTLQPGTTLPVSFAPPPLAQGCGVSASESRFTNLGRGGVPANPTDPLTPSALWHDFLDLEGQGAAPTGEAAAIARPHSAEADSELADSGDRAPQPLREAQGWQRHGDGTVQLVARAPSAPPSVGAPPACTPAPP